MRTTDGIPESLRAPLAEAHPELLQALDRSRSIAVNGWLSGVSSYQGSLGGLPHVQNIEHHLARLCESFRSLRAEGSDSLMTPIETYVLLASILLHDIGKTQKQASHGELAFKIISNNHAELGIPDRRLARMIARISRCHAMPKGSELEDGLERLTTRAVDPYGEVREHCCAALLVLFDHMSTSFCRIVPEYIADADQLGATARFRRHTGDVIADLRGRLIRVVLGDEFDALPVYPDLSPPQWLTAGPSIEGQFIASHEWDSVSDLLRQLDEVVEALAARIGSDREPSEAWKRHRLVRILLARGRTKFPKERRLNRLLQDPKWRSRLCPDETRYRADGFIQLLRSCRRIAILRDIGEDTVENRKALRATHAILSAMGVSFKEWTIEYREHLFAYCGHQESDLAWWVETHEPGLSIPYLQRVAETMWRLSTRIFGEGSFSYETLADAMREPEPERAKRAVFRIARVADRCFRSVPFWIGRSHWRWTPGVRSLAPAAGPHPPTPKQMRDTLVGALANLAPPSGSQAKFREPMR